MLLMGIFFVVSYSSFQLHCQARVLLSVASTSHIQSVLTSITNLLVVNTADVLHPYQKNPLITINDFFSLTWPCSFNIFPSRFFYRLFAPRFFYHIAIYSKLFANFFFKKIINCVNHWTIRVNNLGKGCIKIVEQGLFLTRHFFQFLRKLNWFLKNTLQSGISCSINIIIIGCVRPQRPEI